MEYIDEDCMTDTSEALCPTPSYPSRKSGQSPLQVTDSQIKADTCCLVPSPRITSSFSPGKSSTTSHCVHCQESKEKYKRGKSGQSTLEMIVQGLPRRNLLLNCLETHWEALTVEGLFAMSSHQGYTWTLEGSSDQARRLQHHLILRHLDIEDDLHQCQRSVAERRNLDGYSSFFAEVQAKQKTERDYKRVKQGLKRTCGMADAGQYSSMASSLTTATSSVDKA